MDCGYIEKTDRGIQCEFNNIYMQPDTELIVTEKNRSMDAVSFRESDMYQVPSDLFRKFTELKHLDLEMTQLKELFSENFRNADNLLYFMARYNSLTQLREETFVHCKSLKYIILQYNNISIIHPNAFEGLTKLEGLYIDYNPIVTITGSILKPLTNLENFSAAYCKLNTIPDDMFSSNERMATLNLGNNELEYFNDEQFDNLPHLESIYFNDNKFKKLDLTYCKSTEINVERNQLEEIGLNKWNRLLTAWANPIKNFTLHEHYGVGRTYNFTFDAVDEITFFVNEQCCTKENLESFGVMVQSFGDLSTKNFEIHDWTCKLLKSVGYQSQAGMVVNVVCEKNSPSAANVNPAYVRPVPEVTSAPEVNFAPKDANAPEYAFAPTELPTTTRKTSITNIRNAEDSDSNSEEDDTSFYNRLTTPTIESTVKPRESMEDLAKPAGDSLFTGINIETLDETRSTTVDPSFYAGDDEYISTTESYEKKCEKGIIKVVKKKVVEWKDAAVRWWNKKN
ncbi:unnamed protein product [Diamesa tonsa]